MGNTQMYGMDNKHSKLPMNRHSK